MTGESSKEIIKLAPVKVMKQNYERLYLMTPEEVIEILKENNKYVYCRLLSAGGTCLATTEAKRRVVMLGYPANKALSCGLLWSVS